MYKSDYDIMVKKDYNSSIIIWKVYFKGKVANSMKGLMYPIS